MTNVSIIIGNCKKYEDVLACVESIKKSETTLSYNIIIVDNCAGNNVGIKFALEKFSPEKIKEYISQPTDDFYKKDCEMTIEMQKQFSVDFNAELFRKQMENQK